MSRVLAHGPSDAAPAASGSRRTKACWRLPCSQCSRRANSRCSGHARPEAHPYACGHHGLYRRNPSSYSDVCNDLRQLNIHRPRTHRHGAAAGRCPSPASKVAGRYTHLRGCSRFLEPGNRNHEPPKGVQNGRPFSFPSPTTTTAAKGPTSRQRQQLNTQGPLQREGLRRRHTAERGLAPNSSIAPPSSSG